MLCTNDLLFWRFFYTLKPLFLFFFFEICLYLCACACTCMRACVCGGGGACVRVMFLDKNSDTNCQPVCRISTKGSCLDESCCVVYYKYTCLCGVLYIISSHCVCVVYNEYIISMKHRLATRRPRAGWEADACPSHVARRARAVWNRSISNARLEKRTSDVREGGSPSHAFMKNKVNNFHFRQN